jgi:hypothetical protein
MRLSTGTRRGFRPLVRIKSIEYIDNNVSRDDDQEHREVLNLPMEGVLKPSEINATFRRLATTAHPDAGGSDEHYRRIAEARDALLEQFASAS